MKEERVVGLGGRLRDRQGGGMGEAVAVADDEALEGIGGVEGDVELALAGTLERTRGEGDVRDVIADSGDGGEDEAAVAALDPGANALGGGDLEDIAAETGGP